MMCLDNAKKTFSTVEEFTEFLQTRASGKKWLTADLYEMVFNAIGCGPLFMSQVRDNLKLGTEVSDDAILSTITDGVVMGTEKGSEFAVTIEGKNYLLDSIGLYSAAMMLIGNTNKFAKLSMNKKKEALDVFLSLKAKKPVKVLYAFEKVRTVQSEHYSIMEQEELVDTLLKYMDTAFPNPKFEGASYEHHLTQATWALPEQKKDLMEDYMRTCKAAGITSTEDFEPCIKFQTSDTGASAVTLIAVLKKGNFEIPIGEALKLPHMSNNGIPEFEGELEKVYAQYKDLTACLSRIVGVTIEHPTNCIRKIGELVKIPPTYLDSAVEAFELTTDEGEPVHAHDIFFALEETIFEMSLNKVADSTCERVRENLARTLAASFDWKAYDKR